MGYRRRTDGDGFLLRVEEHEDGSDGRVEEKQEKQKVFRRIEPFDGQQSLFRLSCFSIIFTHCVTVTHTHKKAQTTIFFISEAVDIVFAALSQQISSDTLSIFCFVLIYKTTAKTG